MYSGHENARRRGVLAVTGILAAGIAAALLLTASDAGDGAAGSVSLGLRTSSALPLRQDLADGSKVSQALLQVRNKLAGPDKELDSDVDHAASGLEHWLFAQAQRRPSAGSRGSRVTHNKHVTSQASDRIQEERLFKPKKGRSTLDAQASSILHWFGLSHR